MFLLLSIISVLRVSLQNIDDEYRRNLKFIVFRPADVNKVSIINAGTTLLFNTSMESLGCSKAANSELSRIRAAMAKNLQTNASYHFVNSFNFSTRLVG